MIEDRDIEKLAALSRINISADEKTRLKDDIESVLSYVSEITKVAAASGIESYSSLKNVMREDASPHESGLYTESLLDAAPSREGNYFRVKKILSAKS